MHQKPGHFFSNDLFGYYGQINAEWRALKSCGFTAAEELPEVRQPAQVLLSGLVIMADWIASNTSYFPLIPVEQVAVDDHMERLSYAWNSWFSGQNWDPSANISGQSVYSNSADLYRRRFGFDEPRDMQRKFSEVILQTKEPGIFILEAPMGEGKTEAALVAAELLARKTGGSGIFFGLPTQATSNGIFPRIEQWLESISMDQGQQDNPYRPRLVHGKAALNESSNEEKGQGKAENVDVDGLDKGNVAVNEWFCGRKTGNLDDFVVATVDQFLMLSLKQKHLALRHLGFSKKIVIIDEVHAYDAYMSQYLYMAVSWMAAYGVPVIILSATLPAGKREELVYSYMSGLGLNWSKEVILPAQGLKTDAYPLITYTDGPIASICSDFEKGATRAVEIRPVPEEDLGELVDKLYMAEGVVGVIVNTVRRAQELARECTARYGRDHVELLHSGFIATDRIVKERKLISMIGKGAERPATKIIIGTQVIEQSLDIDFDVLISDLAPMDLLIQRVGRLHRHGSTKRPPDHTAPVLYVLGSDRSLDFEDGSRAVYGEYLLARTQYFLPETLTIPDDISPLVQAVYDEKTKVVYGDDLHEKYEVMKQKHAILLKNKKLKADVYRIDKPVLNKKKRKGNSLIGWLNHSHPNESEERAFAQVRDSNETIEVIAVQKVAEGYGVFGSTEDLADQVSNSRTAKELARHTVNLPQVLSAPYRIDQTINELEQYKLKYLKAWQEQPWLKGTLGVIFDESGNAQINGFTLNYDLDYGLSYERLNDGKI